MKIETKVTLSREEIRPYLKYDLICETMGSSFWSTVTVERKFAKTFTEPEREEIKKIYRLAHKWHLKTGIPEKVEMTVEQFCLWKTLARFCGRVGGIYE